MTCPLCRMAEATMADGAVEKSGGWAVRPMRSAMGRRALATVGAYAAWVSEHDARFVDGKIKNFSTRLNL